METMEKSPMSPAAASISPASSAGGITSSTSPLTTPQLLDFSLGASVKNKRKNFSPRYSSLTSPAAADDGHPQSSRSLSSASSTSSAAGSWSAPADSQSQSQVHALRMHYDSMRNAMMSACGMQLKPFSNYGNLSPALAAMLAGPNSPAHEGSPLPQSLAMMLGAPDSPPCNDSAQKSSWDYEHENEGDNEMQDDEENDSRSFGACSSESQPLEPMSEDQFSNDGSASCSESANGAVDLQKPAEANLFDKCSLGLFSPVLMAQTRTEESLLSTDSIKNLTKFSSYLECKAELCRTESLREHYHCHERPCLGKALSKKEQVIRHLKWHKKRNESLNHGFLRFSSEDDCSVRFGPSCTHNRRQTHYHCCQPNCDKVYISTSDVQMHSNYHRKDSAIFQEGFQRYRASEECKAAHCLYANQRTTHFHCRRGNCRFTFKNKSDMEKHKSYHIKDLQLARDGFKKFLKTQGCPFPKCRFSRVCNHIHCVRENCFYVLHSSGQLISHKRKHERVDSELAKSMYRLWKKLPSAEPEPRSNGDGNGTSVMEPDFVQQMHQRHSELLSREAATATKEEPASPPDAPSCTDLMQSLHYYFTDKCTLQYKRPADNGFQSEPLNLKNGTCDEPAEKLVDCAWAANAPHLHCVVKDCDAVVYQNIADIAAHIRLHECDRQHGEEQQAATIANNHMQITSIDGFFNRKRGRPPKNRVVEVYNRAQHSPQAIFTSFKLEKQSPEQAQMSPHVFPQPPASTSTSTSFPERQSPAPPAPMPFVSRRFFAERFNLFMSSDLCQPRCPLSGQMHFHCMAVGGCDFVGEVVTEMNDHWVMVHDGRPGQPPTSGRNNCYRHIAAIEQCSSASGDVCRLARREHFHCVASKGCEYVSDGITGMNAHWVRVHYPQQRPEPAVIKGGCGIAECVESKAHMHCPRCLRPVQTQDELRSHQCGAFSAPPEYEEETESYPSAVKLEPEDDDKVSVVRAAGTYFPINTADKPLPAEAHSQPRHMRPESPPPPAGQSNCERPFCKLKRKPHAHCDMCNQGFTDNGKMRLHRAKHGNSPLGRLAECNGSSPDHPQDLSVAATQAKLEPPAPDKAAPVFQPPSVPNMQPLLPPIMPPNFPGLHLAHLASLYQHSPYMYHHFYPMLRAGVKMQQQQQQAMIALPFSNAATMAAAAVAAAAAQATATANEKRKRKMDPWLELATQATQAKQMKTPDAPGPSGSPGKAPNFKIFKDEPIPSGYLKFRFNEDCNFANCGYRNHQSHFHCVRNDCFYSFCDKTRFVQHTARHERLDKLMGDDFKQYRANMRCGYDDCAYNNNQGANNKSSHFHCLKCNFICSDTNKVVAHRRQHSKMEYIRQAGFRKVANNERCPSSASATDPESGECVYSLKQTHYHCLVCECSVLSRAQLSSHRHRS